MSGGVVREARALARAAALPRLGWWTRLRFALWRWRAERAAPRVSAGGRGVEISYASESVVCPAPGLDALWAWLAAQPADRPLMLPARDGRDGRTACGLWVPAPHVAQLQRDVRTAIATYRRSEAYAAAVARRERSAR